MANKVKYPNNYQGTLAQIDSLPAGASVDDIFYFQSGGEYYKRIIDGSVRAAHAGIWPDGTDQTSAINTALSHSDVHELIFDYYNKSITISGTVDVPVGKKLVFKNKCKIIGTGTITNALIECDYKKQCFGTSLTVTNLYNSVISVMWFGAVPDLHYTGSVAAATDNQPLFVKAAAAGKELFPGTSLYSIRTKLYIPAADQGYMYRFASYFPLDHSLELYGDGRQVSRLYFGTASKGIWVRYYASDSSHTGSQYPYLHDFAIIGNYGSESASFQDGTSHGLTVNTYGGRYERLDISGFDGNGIELSGGVPDSNANNNHFLDIKAFGNGGYGFHPTGGDANAWSAMNCDFSGNAIAGLLDDSGLGGTAVNCHTASNGFQHTKNRSSVAVPSGLYWCKLDNTNIEPGVTAGWESYWTYVAVLPSPGYTDAYWHAWDSATNYKASGGYVANGASQLSVFLSCYAESDQNTFLNIGGNAMVINGFAGGFGTGLGALGMLQGYPTLAAVQGWDAAANFGVRIDGLQKALSWVDTANGVNFGLRYNNTDKYLGISQIGSGALGLFITAPGFNPGFMNRSALDAGSAVSINGYFSYRQGSSGYRMIGIASAAPTTGIYAEGDILLNASGTAGTALGWRCITAGTPGTWEPIYVTTRGTTGSRPTLGSGDAGCPYFDTTLSKPVWWTGTAWVDATGTTV